MREVFRRIDGILRQLQAMAEVELRWWQEIEDLRQELLQPSAAFFNEYHLQEVKPWPNEETRFQKHALLIVKVAKLSEKIWGTSVTFFPCCRNIFCFSEAMFVVRSNVSHLAKLGNIEEACAR